METTTMKRNESGAAHEVEEEDLDEDEGEDEAEVEETKPKFVPGTPFAKRSHHKKGGGSDLFAWVKKNQVPLLVGTGVVLLFWLGRSKRSRGGSEYVGQQLRFNMPQLPFLPSISLSPQGQGGYGSDYGYSQPPYGQSSYRPRPRRRYFPASPYRTPGILPARAGQQYQAEQPVYQQYQPQPQYQQQYQPQQQPVTYTPYPMPQPATRKKAPAAPVHRAPDEGVRAVQWALNSYFGSQLLNEDGLMGDTTANLIRDFQSHAGLPVTGSMDRVTHDALSKGVAQKQAAQQQPQQQMQPQHDVQQPEMYASADQGPDASWTSWASQWQTQDGAPTQQAEQPFPATLEDWRKQHGEA